MDIHNTTQSNNVTLKWLGNNDTLGEVAQYFNLSVIQLSNFSDEIQTITQVKLFDLYDMYKSKEKEQLMAYKLVAYILGSLIIISNLTVVISSGLILKKGQQPKSTYLLLGNVSLADTIVGMSIIFGAIVDHNVSSFCVFQIGMLVCPAMVSIFSVGLIAVDRYIYIVHGLYYQRWFNTTKVRIGIVCIWMIGIILGFMPATGWVNTEARGHSNKCFYVNLFPGSLVLLNSLLSIIPIIVVAVLYSIILVKALANVNKIRASRKSASKLWTNNMSKSPQLRIYIGNKTENNRSIKTASNHNKIKIKRSMSLTNHYENQENKTNIRSFMSKSINGLNENGPHETKQSDKIIESMSSSLFSICTVESSTTTTDPNYSSYSDVPDQTNRNVSNEAISQKRKIKEPNKLRAITVVMLTSGSFIFTWLPFFIVVICYILCEDKYSNQKCIYLRGLLAGPTATIAFLNSVLNPLIYAWWHKGFKRYVKMYCAKIWQKYKSRQVTNMNV